MAISCCCIVNPLNSPPLSSSFNGFLGYPTPQFLQTLTRKTTQIKGLGNSEKSTKTSNNSTPGFRIRCGFLPLDPWAPSIGSQSVASQLFAASLLPYLGFLYFITKSKTAPKLTLVGFYFLLAFVGATIPAGIYAKVNYGTSLANVDWLHGGAESLLTITNLLIVLGLREGLRRLRAVNRDTTG
ncbi:uncharacterized protein A4U43_UnF8310 [Asparagus officinalis]|uniref:DUF3593 domain-containing protein n=1 Tax=Asparagus officinalis TaxID=4686 RepID=A0A1R3L5Z9_ASPOF|nr:uncharacterized protein LOC109827900 [Asparagus officinalis]ONK55037.1 uncharacterized protein A4U43_UnF8310 [Asparagus officinalis]